MARRKTRPPPRPRKRPAKLAKPARKPARKRATAAPIPTKLASAAEPIFATIRKQPDDPAAYLVLADLLQTAGDPRGELISVQHALAAAPGDAKLRRAEAALLKTHATALLGADLPKAIKAFGKQKQRSQKGDRGVALTWRLGFLRHAYVSIADAGDQLVALLAALFASPSAPLLEALRLVVTTESTEPLLRTLAAAPPTLADLRISSMNGSLRPLAKLWPSLQALRVLHLGQWDSVDLGDLALPGLEDLEIVGLKQADNATLLARAPATLRRLHVDVHPSLKTPKVLPLLANALPQLRDLRIQVSGKLEPKAIDCGQLERLWLSPVSPRLLPAIVAAGGRLRGLGLQLSSSVTGKHLAPILDGGLPELRHLQIGQVRGSTPIDLLARSKLLPRLETLSLIDAGRDDITRLTESASAFAHLREIRLLDGYAFKAATKALPQLRYVGDSWIP
jgi:uncharacterized protein (TIGR02996 family)